MTVPAPTQRVSFRQLVPDDLDFVAEMLSDAEVMRYYPHTYTRTQAQDWLDRQLMRYARDGHALWLVSDTATGAPLGQVGLMMQDVEELMHPEVGYLIHRPFWRQGYAVEAALATRDFAFGVTRLPYVVSMIRPENIPSRGVAAKLGMQPLRNVNWRGFVTTIFRVENANLPL